MSRFHQELQVIPRAGWWIAGGVYLCMATVLGVLSFSKGNAHLPLPGAILMTVFAPAFPGAFALLIAYINGDARRRAMHNVMWTLLAIFIPNGIGIILYFLLRHPLGTACSSCGTPSPHAFAFCTACGTPLKGACPQCRRNIEPAWSNCAFCGVKL